MTFVNKILCRVVISSAGHLINWSFVIGLWHSIIKSGSCSFCLQIFLLLFSQFDILSSCHFALLSFCPLSHFVLLSFCPIVILSSCHFVILYSCHFLIAFYQSFHQLISSISFLGMMHSGRLSFKRGRLRLRSKWWFLSIIMSVRTMYNKMHDAKTIGRTISQKYKYT